MLKHHYPSDPDFCRENFWDLPYDYVVTAAHKIQKYMLQDAHIAERPIAQLTSVLYNINRGKKTKPVTPEQLYLYASRDDLNLPEGRFGVAMLHAIKQKLFPSWALFVYKELKDTAAGPLPDPYIAVCSDVIVLAPLAFGKTLSGLVITQESASNKIRQLATPDGTIYTVRMPPVTTKYMADENWELDLVS